jgi:hypothetical protein
VAVCVEGLEWWKNGKIGILQIEVGPEGWEQSAVPALGDSEAACMVALGEELCEDWEDMFECRSIRGGHGA